MKNLFGKCPNCYDQLVLCFDASDIAYLYCPNDETCPWECYALPIPKHLRSTLQELSKALFAWNEMPEEEKEKAVVGNDKVVKLLGLDCY
jgi:hypothetical protein